MKQKLPAGLVDNNIEIFAESEHNVKALFEGRTVNFLDLPQYIIDFFLNEMYGNSSAMIAFHKAKFNSIEKMLLQYVWCNYGGFDNTPDYNTELNNSIKEFWDCGKRENCPFNGCICGQLIAPNGEHLTRQEIKIIKLISQGHFDAELADALNISPNTIISHKANIFRKLQVNSKNEVTIYAYNNNLVK
ncbi:MAG: helix-turn-helix transcriptional regulator [Bacteroidales bacterium]|nr:helix-turn-helix transcriptional regulator [Bacteroidales bacterium]